ncbi:MAG: LegC family aminotransferase [Candidatus Eremiobacteraeota bacterium]|nr:LegC family aminotransferase [Candidatus Eremiobacteraeota bacterium]
MTADTTTVDRKMIPLSVPNLCGNEWSYLKECLDTGWVSTAGPFVTRFEKAVAGYTGAMYAVACISGTAGLHVALRLAGVEAGDEVIVPAVTFIAPVNAVRYLSAEPVFMDCDDFLNIDAGKVLRFCEEECELTALGLRNRSSGRMLKALVPVHVFGTPCDMDALLSIAEKFSLKVVEDASESLGSWRTTSRGRVHTGTEGHLGVISFNGNKIVTSGGGGMILTNDENHARRARYLTTQAKDDEVRFIHHETGYNYRLTNTQAALGLAQCENLERFKAVKKKNRDLYKKELGKVTGLSFIGAPNTADPNFWLTAVAIDKDLCGIDRDTVMKALAARKIETRPLWELNHLQKPYHDNQHYRIEKALLFREQLLCLPSGTGLTENDVAQVTTALIEIMGKANG